MATVAFIKQYNLFTNKVIFICFHSNMVYYYFGSNSNESQKKNIVFFSKSVIYGIVPTITYILRVKSPKPTVPKIFIYKQHHVMGFHQNGAMLNIQLIILYRIIIKRSRQYLY